MFYNPSNATRSRVAETNNVTGAFGPAPSTELRGSSCCDDKEDDARPAETSQQQGNITKSTEQLTDQPKQ